MQGTFDNRLIVIQYEIDSEYVHADTSCENSEQASTVEADELAQSGKIINVFIHNEYNPHLRFFYISGMINNRYFNMESFTDLEHNTMKIISNTDSDIYYDLMEIEWEKMTQLKLVA